MTALSLFMSMKALSFERLQFKENVLQYILQSLKAKLGWLPYVDLLKDRRLFFDFNLSRKLKSGGPMGSNLTGNYIDECYRHTEETLKTLTKAISDADNSF